MDDTFTTHEATKRKRRWGCTCGCLIFLLVLFFGAVGMMYYALRPTCASVA